MSTLQENLDAIKLDKNTNLKPENLKKDVTCLGVTGTYEGSGGTVEGIKQFSTIEEMQADTAAQEGDLAVVYRSEIKNATVDSKFQVATFPETIVLDTAITDYVDIGYRAVDDSVMFDCMGNLDSSRFRMDCYGDLGEVRIEYTSSDGITYTRTDTTGNPVDFGTEIYYESAEMWNDAIGNFIQVSRNKFDGLYKYTEVVDTYKVDVLNLDKTITGLIIPDMLQYIDKNLSNLDVADIVIVPIEIQNNIITKGYCIIGHQVYCAIINNKLYVFNNMQSSFSYSKQVQIIEFDTTSENTIISNTILSTDEVRTKPILGYNLTGGSDYTAYQVLDVTFVQSAITTYGWISGTDKTKNRYYVVKNSIGETGSGTISFTKQDFTKFIYTYAPTQLSATSDYVYGKEFYGKNGVEIGILAQDISNSFDDTNAELYSKIQNQYNNLVPRVLTDDAKTIDKNIYCIPVKSDGTPLLDTSSVTNMIDMFFNCTNLTTIPLLDTSSVTTMRTMFYGCTNLATIPLLNASSVTDMRHMFYNCTNLTEIPLLDTSKVTNMQNMFDGCTNLTTIPLLNASSVTDMRHMFENCTSLTEISQLDTSKVTTMCYMFFSCTNLTTIPLLNTSNVTDMANMFSGCSNLATIPLLNTSSVTDMRYMFNGCSKLTTIPLLDTSNVTTMNSMFSGCTNLTEIPQLDTSSVTDMYRMFYNCTNLTEIPLLNTSKVTNMNNMFNGCTSLSDESLNNILAMCTNATTRTKTLKYLGLTSEQAAKCTTLNNYSAFTSAGWTTGY